MHRIAGLRTAVWHSTGLPAAPVRWVPVHDAYGPGSKPCSKHDPRQILSRVPKRSEGESRLPGSALTPRLRDQKAMIYKMAIRLVARAQLELYSLVTLLVVARRARLLASVVGRAAWYDKRFPPSPMRCPAKSCGFRRRLFVIAPGVWTIARATRGFMYRLTDVVCYAA